MRRRPPRLYALTPGDLDVAHVDRFAITAARACAAGLAGILLREPELSDKATLALAQRLRARLGPEGFLALHDRVHLAEAAGADAVHLGFRSLPPADARAILPPSIAIGFSAHAGDAPELWNACDHLLLGPVFATPSKAGWKEPLGPDGLAHILATTTLPVWALGGITAANARALLELGCAGIAVRGALLASADPERAVAELLAAIG
jgi:thiamine-phosphate pyrophosphorylase